VQEAALYLIRTGRVRIRTKDGSVDETFAGGGYFGDDQLLADVSRGKNGPYDPTTTAMAYTVEVLDDCVCGVLTLAVCRKCLDTTNMGKPHASVLDSLVTRQIPMSELKKHAILGAGTFGQVWLVSRKTSMGDRRAYALKVQSKYELVEAGQARAVVYEKVRCQCILKQTDPLVCASRTYHSYFSHLSQSYLHLQNILAQLHSPFIIQVRTV
jgi:hypothetical protein